MTDNISLRNDIAKALLRMGKKHLKREWRSGWSKNNPFYGYCYVVAEYLKHYVYPNAIPYVMRIENGTHWYLMGGINIIDMSIGYYKYNGKPKAFLTKYPSKRCMVLKKNIEAVSGKR